MARFDRYFICETSYYCDDTPLLTKENVSKGAEVWLDGVDGFDVPLFEEKGAGDIIRFAIYDPPPEQDGDWTDITYMLLVEAEIIENRRICAKVRIRRVQQLLEWARTVQLPLEDSITSMPEAIQRLIRREKNALSDARMYGSIIHPAGMGIFSVWDIGEENDGRCLILEETGSDFGSHIIRL